MKLDYRENGIPLTGAKWARRSEAYAALVFAHLFPDTVWLDAGCGRRLLGQDPHLLEEWLAADCALIVGIDVAVSSHRNIRSLVRGSLYALPFANSSLDLVTCNLVVEHPGNPSAAFAEVARCLRLGRAVVISTPNLLNDGVFGNAVASKVIPEKWRARFVRVVDDRESKDIFPVQYMANTVKRLVQLLKAAGLQVQKTINLRQQRPFSQKTEKIERVLMKLTTISGLLVCAHKELAAA